MVLKLSPSYLCVALEGNFVRRSPKRRSRDMSVPRLNFQSDFCVKVSSRRESGLDLRKSFTF